MLRPLLRTPNLDPGPPLTTPSENPRAPGGEPSRLSASKLSPPRFLFGGEFCYRGKWGFSEIFGKKNFSPEKIGGAGGL